MLKFLWSEIEKVQSEAGGNDLVVNPVSCLPHYSSKGFRNFKKKNVLSSVYDALHLKYECN